MLWRKIIQEREREGFGRVLNYKLWEQKSLIGKVTSKDLK